jgi:maltooligosyltrehalose trehalohydrolase
VIYELHVGTFTRPGTFAAAIDHLADLAALGVTHVELMPVAQFPGAHGWGYDGVDLFAAHAPYGGPAGLRAFVQACHREGLAVLIDAVINHVGPEGNYLGELGPYLDERDPTPWGPGIAWGRPEVRRFFLDSALAWLTDYDVDGLRLDAVHAIRDRAVVAELAREVSRLPGRVLIAEYDDHDPWIVCDDGARASAHWNDDFHHAVHALLTGERSGYYRDFASPEAFGRVVEQGYWLDGRWSEFRGGHHGQPFGPLPRDRLVAYVQSHDQIGNRARGERLVHLAGVERAQIAAALLLGSPFVPMLFQGEEWAASTPFRYFCDFGSPELRAAVRDGRRAEHGAEDAADPFDPATRDGCVLDWTERSREPHARMLAWYRAWIAARRDHPALRDPRPGTAHLRRTGDLVQLERGELAVIANLAETAVRIPIAQVLLASHDLARGDELPPLACALVSR